jgi:hypothetical protein
VACEPDAATQVAVGRIGKALLDIDRAPCGCKRTGELGENSVAGRLDETATAIVTMPPPPSAIAVALAQTGMAYASLVSTKDALETVADKVVDTLTIMTPFLNPEGLQLVQQLFARTRASYRRLIVRRAGDAHRHGLLGTNDGTRRRGLRLYGRCERRLRDLPCEGCPVADNQLAYVGSANMTVFARQSMDLGFLVEGRSARVVANVLRAVVRISTPIRL